MRHDIKVFNETFNSKEEKIHPIMRCGLGTTLGSIGYNGNIYGCQEQTSQGEKSIFYIGNIYTGGIDEEKHKNLLMNFYAPKKTICENKKLCENCLLKTECRDFACPSTSYDLFNEFHKDSEIHCLWNLWMVQNSMIMMKKYVEENN